MLPSRLTILLVLSGIVSLCLACAEPARPADRAEAAADAASGGTAADAGRPRIVFLGDSLTAGLGLDVSSNMPSLIQARLDAGGFQYEVVNAGVSGDTSAGGLRRLDWAMEGDVRILIVALGGNDGLRGLPADELRRNLAAIIVQAQQRGVDVVLAGMEAPPNNGPEYTARFRQVYADLAAEYRLAFVPFLLEGVAGERALNQADGIHPNAEGARRVADTVWQTLAPRLAASSGPR